PLVDLLARERHAFERRRRDRLDAVANGRGHRRQTPRARSHTPALEVALDGDDGARDAPAIRRGWHAARLHEEPTTGTPADHGRPVAAGNENEERAGRLVAHDEAIPR